MLTVRYYLPEQIRDNTATALSLCYCSGRAPVFVVIQIYTVLKQKRKNIIIQAKSLIQNRSFIVNTKDRRKCIGLINKYRTNQIVSTFYSIWPTTGTGVLSLQDITSRNVIFVKKERRLRSCIPGLRVKFNGDKASCWTGLYLLTHFNNISADYCSVQLNSGELNCITSRPVPD